MIELFEIYKLCTNPEAEYKKINEEFDVDAAIWEKEDCLYISFQHSNSKKDWLINFSAWKRPYSNMKQKFYAHSGYVSAYRAIREYVFNVYKNYAKEKTELKIIIAGYSLGGALAKLCYEDFFWRSENDNNFKNLKIEGYSIGAPNVFSSIKNKKEIKRRLSNFISIVNGNDIVTKVPPFWLLYFREVEDIILGKRLPFIGVALPSALYAHHWESYKGRIIDRDFKDNSKNNPVYKKSVLFYSALYFIFALLMLYLIVLKNI